MYVDFKSLIIFMKIVQNHICDKSNRNKDIAIATEKIENYDSFVFIAHSSNLFSMCISL